jgi:hypothetical protein
MDVFEVMHTLRAMRRLKPDLLPDDVLFFERWGQRAQGS